MPISQAEPPKRIPGSRGQPFLFAIIASLWVNHVVGWKAYFLGRRRRLPHSLFRVAAFGRAIAVTDAKGFRVFSEWDGRLRKEYGFGPFVKPPRPLVGDITPSIFCNGLGHSGPKAMHVAILKDRARDLERDLDAALDAAFADWAERGQISLRDEIERSVERFLVKWLLQARASEPLLQPLYNNLFEHGFWWWSRWLPWSDFDDLVEMHGRQLAALKASPGFQRIAALPEAKALGDEELAAKQVAFLMGVNCYLGLQNLFKSIAGELSRNPQAAIGIREEVDAAREPETGALDWAAMTTLPQLDRFLKEVLRLHPPVFFVYGTATRDFALETSTGRYRVPEGERLVGVIPVVQRDPEVFPDPERFDPSRFEDGEAETGLVWPHGFLGDPVEDVHGHLCPGRDVAVLIAKRFCARLASECEWTMADGPPAWSDGKFHLNVAAPEGEMIATGFARRAGA